MPVSASAARPIEANELADILGSLTRIGSKAEAEKTLKRLEVLRKRGGALRLVAGVDALRGIVLTTLGRFTEADTAFAASAQAQPTESFPLVGQFDISASFGNHTGARYALDRLINGFPDVARSVSGEKLYPVLHAMRKQDADAADTMTVRLASIGWGEDLISSRDAMALSAAKVELKRKNFEAAHRIAGRIIDRTSLVELLTYRRFEQLWQATEARVGDRMEQPTREAVLHAEARLAEQPESIGARRELLIAYRNARRLADAERVGAAFAKSEDALGSLTEDGGWLVNDHAMLLLRLGRNADSDARFAALRRLPIAQAPWLINMIINRAEFLTRTSRDAQAWPLIEEAEVLSKSYGSPYAQQLVRRMKACVAFRSKREGASALIQAFIDNAQDAAGATVEGLMCVDRADQAARDVIALLGDDDKRDGVVDSLVADEDTRADPSSWGASKLLDRADVRAAFDKVARDLPARFVTPKDGLSP